MNASYLDPPVLCAVLQTLAELTPQAVTEALAQEQQVHVQHQWQHAHVLQKAESAVTLAERRYKAVDPDNRLVRQRIERDYEDALRHRTECELTLARMPMPVAPATSPDDAQTLLPVASDVRNVWDPPAVTNEERKELLRALLKQIVCHENTPGFLDLTLQWHGGATSAVCVHRPSAIKQRILAHWQTGATVTAITTALNAAGLQTRVKRPWSLKTVDNILYTHARSTEQWGRTQQRLWALSHEGLRGKRWRIVSTPRECGRWPTIPGRVEQRKENFE